MHFRARKNVVQLVRTSYDAKSKRPVTTIVGRMPRHAPAIHADLRKALTDAEVTEAEAWIAGTSRLQTLRSEVAALTLPESIELARQWFEHSDDDAARNVAANIVAHWTELRRTMKKKGLIE